MWWWGVPNGGIFRVILGKVAKCFAIVRLHIRAVATNWPVFLQTKHESLLDIMLPVEDGRVAVTCCAALNFSTSLITFDKVREVLLVDLCFGAVCILNAFNEDTDGGSVAVEIVPFGFCFKSVCIGCQGFIVPLFDFHEM